MKNWLFISASLLAASCAVQKQPLQVKQYHLRESMFQENNDPMVRGEIQRRLHGAISLAERRGKVGQYYTVKYSGEREQSHNDVVTLLFEYQQAGTASLIKRIAKTVNSSSENEVEFAIVGKDYAENGRVLTWRVRVIDGSRVVAEKKSYLWR